MLQDLPPLPLGRHSVLTLGLASEELDSVVLKMLPYHSTIAATCVYKFWTSTWERVVEQATLSELITMAVMNTTKGFILNNKLYRNLTRLSGKLDKAEVKSKKLA
ncbi:hypothetical protein Adt_36927 [Abeliophyllum distichum]|uniref:Uncharacterized protein n=1 Tax=Abeliophyllum distichum TaxID=126358 RepID=A0ABD1QJE3_9LAMI